MNYYRNQPTPTNTTADPEKKKDTINPLSIAADYKIHSEFPHVCINVVQAHITRKSLKSTFELPPPDEIFVDQTHANFWQDLYRRFGLDTSYAKPSFQTLTEWYKSDGHLQIGSKIDEIYNGIAVKNQINITAFDSSRLVSPIKISVSNGYETFVPLGAGEDEAEPVAPDIVIKTSGDIVISTYWNYKESELTKITRDSTRFTFLCESDAELFSRNLESILDFDQIFAIDNISTFFT